MQEVYQGHFAGGGRRATKLHKNAAGESVQQQPKILFGQRPIHTGSIDLEAYTRSAANDIDQRFARLPNPTLVLYVFPHLGADNHYPVPGYSTAFPLYEQVYYALPGEAERQP